MTAGDVPKQQFNIYLSAPLVRRVKHAAIDAEQSLATFVAEALERHLRALKRGDSR